MIDADNALFDKIKADIAKVGNDKVTYYVIDVYQLERMLFKIKESFAEYKKSMIENTLIIGSKILHIEVKP